MKGEPTAGDLTAGDPMTAYAGPAGQLLTFGEPDEFAPEKWPDYPARFGLEPAHVPDLIRMACDSALDERDYNDPLSWAPMHAWRTLGQLHAGDAIAPLLILLDAHRDHDGIREDIPIVLGMIGPAALAPLTAFITERMQDPDGVAPSALEAIGRLGGYFPAHRDECIAILTRLLARHNEIPPTNNGFIISVLLELKAVEAIDAIRAANASGGVDFSICGDTEDVEMALGLREKRDTPRPRYNPGLDSLLGQRKDDDFPWEPEQPRQVTKIGRNEPCPCGSGKKYKKCCMAA